MWRAMIGNYLSNLARNPPVIWRDLCDTARQEREHQLGEAIGLFEMR